jgi:rod shape determining protein RodA
MKLWVKFDFILLLVTLLLVGYGLVLIYSVTYPPPPGPGGLPGGLVFRQAVYAVVGLILLLLISSVDYQVLAYNPLDIFSPTRRRGEEPGGIGPSLHYEQYSAVVPNRGRFDVAGTLWLFWESISHPLYLVNIGLLVLVDIIGRVSYGAQRAISLELFDVQPSELAKLLLVITLAKFLADHRQEIGQLRVFLASLLQAIIPIVLVLLQPDLGTALILAAIWLGMIFLAGAPLRHLALLAGAAIMSTPLIWQYGLQDYHRQRVLTFLDPLRDPLGQGYNIIQSRISVGSGGWFGRGFLSGTQSQLHFLRVQYSEYIFSVLGEELGFVGALLLLLLFAVLIFRGLRIASLAQDDLGRLAAGGIAVWLICQFFINVGMNVGLLPVTGITLPFISYGGSSLVTILLALGLWQSILMRHKRLEF